MPCFDLEILIHQVGRQVFREDIQCQDPFVAEIGQHVMSPRKNLGRGRGPLNLFAAVGDE